MEEMSPAIAVTLSLGNSGCDNPRVANQVEITRLKLVTDAVTLFSNPPTPPKNEIDTDAIIQECEEDEILSPVDDATGINPEEFLVLDSNTGSTLPTPVEIINPGNGRTVEKAINLDSNVVKESTIILQLPGEGKSVVGGTKSVFELEWIPLWGSVCIQGRRPEMEDAVSAVPWSVKIPMQMLISHRAVDKMGCSLSHLRGHFFGVYDGHGGSQVANYCRDRIHLALAEDLGMVKNDSADGSNGTACQLQWEMAFTSCFAKVDDEVAGKVNQGITMNDGEVSDAISEPVAPETVGSTAIVALICSSHLIVASCGDSRAVLCRGKAAMALSVDHKPNREDEHARIEASGGKVIQWNGHRVFGVLAMSRSIGDRYLKPWIIPEPEVTLLPRAREDECLVLASDGLWDVMTNEEVCEVARRRILLWHKKNGPTSPAERGKGVDPAAQAAAEYLSALALQRGSKDNISVIVVDLKAQRKFKNKTR